MRDGVNCFFDKKSIQWGENWVMALEKGLDEADIVVVVLSPDYMDSEWGRFEHNISMIDDPRNISRKIRPLLLKDFEIPLFLRHIINI